MKVVKEDGSNAADIVSKAALIQEFSVSPSAVAKLRILLRDAKPRAPRAEYQAIIETALNRTGMSA